MIDQITASAKSVPLLDLSVRIKLVPQDEMTRERAAQQVADCLQRLATYILTGQMAWTIPEPLFPVGRPVFLNVHMSRDNEGGE